MDINMNPVHVYGELVSVPLMMEMTEHFSQKDSGENCSKLQSDDSKRIKRWSSELEYVIKERNIHFRKKEEEHFFKSRLSKLFEEGKDEVKIESIDCVIEWFHIALKYVDESFIFVSGTARPDLFEDERIQNMIIDKAKAGTKFLFITGKWAKLEKENGEILDHSPFVKVLENRLKDADLYQNIHSFIKYDTLPFLHYAVIDNHAAVVESLHKADEMEKHSVILCARKYKKQINILWQKAHYCLANPNVMPSRHADYFEVANYPDSVLKDQRLNEGYTKRNYNVGRRNAVSHPLEWVMDALNLELKTPWNVKVQNYLEETQTSRPAFDYIEHLKSEYKDMNTIHVARNK